MGNTFKDVSKVRGFSPVMGNGRAGLSIPKGSIRGAGADGRKADRFDGISKPPVFDNSKNAHKYGK